MFKYFVFFAAVGVWSGSAFIADSFGDFQSISDEKVDFGLASRNNFRALAGGISDKISSFINEVLALPDSADKPHFLEPAEILLTAAEDLQNSIFDVDSGISIIELYRIDSEIDQLQIELDEYKKNFYGTSTMAPPPTTPIPPVTATSSYTNPDVRKSFELVCSEVDRSKVEIMSYPADLCSAHKLLPNLTDCQALCSRVRPYFYELIYSPPSVSDQLRFSTDIRRCQSIVEIWKLLRNIQPDRTTLDQTCANIGGLGLDIGRFQVAQCEKDPFLKDQRILFTICARLQREYSNIDPDTLQKTYKDLVDKLNELSFRWESYKGDAIIHVTRPASPRPTYPPHTTYATGLVTVPTYKPYNPNSYNYNFQGRGKEIKSGSQYTSVFKPLVKSH